MTTIGFIGLGTMGAPMAANLLKKGYSITVYNRTQSKADELKQLGADIVSTPAEAARAADVLFTMVSDDQALQEVFYNAEGIINGLRPGLTIFDCSTVSPELSRQLHDELTEHDVGFLDAPVTGSEPAAIAGTLIFMIGGDKLLLEEHRDILLTMGSHIYYMGSIGSGSQTKLAMNTISAINMAGFIEGIAIATKSGLDLETFMDLVLTGGASSRIAELKKDKLLDRDFTAQFSLKLMLKDLQLAQKQAIQLRLPTPLLQTVESLYRIGHSKGLGDEDLSALIQCYEDWMHQQISRQEPKDTPQTNNRRKSVRVPVDIKLQISVYQWLNEGSFSGQSIEALLYDLSEAGMQIVCDVPLAEDMFIVIHFPQEAELPPITGKIIRIDRKENMFYYGCLISGIAPHTRKKLERYIGSKINQAVIYEQQ